MLLEVTPSGTVGKQTIPVGRKTILKTIIGSPSAANVTVKVRDGNASGEVVFFGRFLSANGVWPIEAKHKFTKGMHVKVVGDLGAAYLELE